MNVVGMVSAYKEGRLVRGAIESLLRVGLDALYVWEGPAGDPLGDDVPDSDYPYLPTLRDLQDADELGTPCVLHRGRWRTDARKRTDMLHRAQRDFPGELWGVVLDGDEVLYNAEYLRDMIQAVSWDDERTLADYMEGRRPDLSAATPTARMPLRLVERDGSISLITARVIRCDLIRQYDISSSLVTNREGVQEGWGNRLELSPMWVDAWAASLERGQLVCLPPFPCEPCIVHRSHLRHPARRGLRMQDQETRLLDEAKRAAGL